MEMKSNGVSSKKCQTWAFIPLNALFKAGKLDETNNLFELMIQRGLKPNSFTYNILMDGLCMVGRINDAQKMLDRCFVQGGKDPRSN